MSGIYGGHKGIYFNKDYDNAPGRRDGKVNTRSNESRDTKKICDLYGHLSSGGDIGIGDNFLATYLKDINAHKLSTAQREVDLGRTIQNNREIILRKSLEIILMVKDYSGVYQRIQSWLKAPQESPLSTETIMLEAQNAVELSLHCLRPSKRLAKLRRDIDLARAKMAVVFNEMVEANLRLAVSVAEIHL